MSRAATILCAGFSNRGYVSLRMLLSEFVQFRMRESACAACDTSASAGELGALVWDI
jgi:hypothetical protein